MDQRQAIRERLDNIMKRSVTTGTPHNNEMRELAALTPEILLEVIDTLDKIDATNVALNKSNEALAKSNLNLQRVAIGIALTGVVVAVVLGVLSLQHDAPTVIYPLPAAAHQ